MPRTIPHAEAHQDRLLSRADASADRAESAVLRVWLDTLRAIKAGGSWVTVYLAARHALHSLPAVATAVTHDLAALHRDAATWTAEHLVATLPQRARLQLLRRRGLVEAESPSEPPVVTVIPHPSSSKRHRTIFVDPKRLDAEWAAQTNYYIPPGGGGAEIAGRIETVKRFLATGKPLQASKLVLDKSGRPFFDDGRHRFSVLRDLGVERVAVTVPAGQAAEIERRFGFPKVVGSPAVAREANLLVGLILPRLDPLAVQRVVYASGWVQQIQRLTALAAPDALAARIALGVTQGLSVQAIARQIRPLVQGVQASARRVARTAGLWVAHEAERDVYRGLEGDLIAGYTIRAVLDHATRPEHRRRDGQQFFCRPGPAQRGMAECPHPPREADGTWAFNCRCWLAPILALG